MSSDDCLILNIIFYIVKSCFKNDMEWKERVVMKNCLVYVNMCNGIYLYYCLIDIYFNELVEVCVKLMFIYLGK